MWDITGSGVLVGGDVGAWFSRFLGVECQVIYMSPKHKGRAVHSDPIFGHLARLDNEVSANVCVESLGSYQNMANCKSDMDPL